jgi:transposase
LLASLSDDRRNTFFKLWISKQAKKKALLFDITSISSYGKNNAYVERGYNRDHENLRQINLGLLSAHSSNVPLWYSELPGSMSDSIVLDHVLGSLEKLDVKDINLVGDRGFYSEANLRNIAGKGQKFTIPVPSSLKWQKELIDKVRDSIRRPANIIRNPEDDKSYIYGLTDYKTESYGRTWRHVYFDPVRKEQDIASLMLKLRKCEEELASGDTFEKHKNLYNTYFIVKETPKRGRKVSLNEQAVNAYINGYSGFWIILTNAEKDASKALEHYNRRCDIEFHFDDMKNLLDCNRLNVHGERTMKGRLFVNFITLILLNDLRGKVSAIKPRDRKYWDFKDMLNKVATYSRIHFTGTYKDLWTVPTKAQRLIFDLLKIEYHWKGETMNVEELNKTEDDDEQEDEKT